MTDDRFLVDLTAFVRSRSEDPEYRLLTQLVRQAYSMASVRMDLHHALAMMDLLASRQTSLKESAAAKSAIAEAEALNASALFMSALILYTRSVHSQGHDRSTLSLAGKLDDRTRKLHERIIELRNRHFAHYATADKWEDWRVVAVVEDALTGISFPNDRRFLRGEDASALHDLLRTVQPLAESAYSRASQRLVAEIDELIARDDRFVGDAAEFHFDDTAFFSPEELEGFRQSLRQSAAFWHSPEYRAALPERREAD